MPEAHFVETPSGVNDAKHFVWDGIDYVVLGLEDGSLHVYNLTKGFGKSYSLPPNPPSRSLKDESPYDQFTESIYEHHDCIVSI